MDNKLSELSKPVAYVVTGGRAHHDWPFIIKSTAERARDERKDGATVKPLYSQEYVSALIQRAERLDSILTESVQALKETEQKSAELEQAMRHIHGALLDITVPRVAIAKAAELAVEHASMKEQSNG